MSKKVKNGENGSDIDKNGQNEWKMKKIIIFGFFQKNMKKCRKRWKMMKMGQILMKTVKINNKWKKIWIFSQKYGKMSKNVQNDENGSDIDENGQNWKQVKNYEK